MRQLNLDMHASKGVGMVELLVAMIVVAVGVLGLGALQLQATRASGNSAYFSQAVWVVQDMVNRVQTSQAAFKDQTFSSTTFCASPPTRDCSSDACDADQLRTWDLFQVGCQSDWRRSNPGAAIPLNQEISNPLDWFASPEIIVDCTQAATDATRPDCRVSMTWALREGNPAATDISGTANQGQYFIEFEFGRDG